MGRRMLRRNVHGISGVSLSTNWTLTRQGSRCQSGERYGGRTSQDHGHLGIARPEGRSRRCNCGKTPGNGKVPEAAAQIPSDKGPGFQARPGEAVRSAKLASARRLKRDALWRETGVCPRSRAPSFGAQAGYNRIAGAARDRTLVCCDARSAPRHQVCFDPASIRRGANAGRAFFESKSRSGKGDFFRRALTLE